MMCTRFIVRVVWSMLNTPLTCEGSDCLWSFVLCRQFVRAFLSHRKTIQPHLPRTGVFPHISNMNDHHEHGSPPFLFAFVFVVVLFLEKLHSVNMAASPVASVSSTIAALSSGHAAAGTAATDERALLILLQDEVKRLQNQKSEKNNETRTLLEMKVAMEQLEAVTEQRRRLTEDVAKERASNTKFQHRIKELEQDAVLKSEQRKVSETHLQEEINELRQQLDRTSSNESELRANLETAERNLNLAKERAVSAKKEYTACEQINFEQSTILKSKLTAALAEIDYLKEHSLKDTGSFREREYDLSQAVAGAQRERQHVQHDLAAERRAHIEDVTELKKALHEAQQNLTNLQSSYEANSRLDHEKLIRLTSELQLLREKATSDATASAAREKALDEQNMKMISDLKVAQSEINQMASQEWTDKKALTQKLIEVTVARDVAVQNAAELREKQARVQQDYTADIATLQNQLSQANSKLENESAQRVRDSQDDKRKVVDTQARLDASTAEVDKLQQDIKNLKNEMERIVATKDAEILSTKTELRATVETLHRLEQQIMDNVQVKLLTDENNSLREQCSALKSRVVEMTSSLANMRAEADISESARVTSVQGLVADYHRRIIALEKEQRFSRPLIKDLAALCGRNQLLDAVLERDLELYSSSFTVQLSE